MRVDWPVRGWLNPVAAGLIILSAVAPAGAVTPVQTVVTYKSTVTSDAGGLLDLKAELNYDSAKPNAPIVVVMHGYSGSTGKMAEPRANAQRLRDAGFFAVGVALRGRDGSDGIRDSGGVEIYDIYDAVEYVKTQYGSLVDETNISIVGYSGGGGNAMSALTKFPDYFRAGSSFFGMSDYGYNATTGWYFDGADASHRSQMVTDIGNPTLGNPTTADRYMARASNLASRNNPYSEIHLFANADEPTCPTVNDTTYRANAVAAASFAGEFNNISVHIGGPGLYVDFDNDHVNDANELQSWPHGYPNANQQQAGESWYLQRLLNGSIPHPVLNTVDDLFVAGFVKTERFGLWLGDGQNATGDLQYNLTGGIWSFALDLLSNNKAVEGTLTVDTAQFSGRQVQIEVNGALMGSFVGGGTYTYPSLGDGDLFKLIRVPILGDLNGDELVNIFDINLVSSHWGEAGPAGDANGDTIVNIFDINLISSHWTASATAVPEPATLVLIVVGAVCLAGRLALMRCVTACAAAGSPTQCRTQAGSRNPAPRGSVPSSAR